MYSIQNTTPFYITKECYLLVSCKNGRKFEL